MEEFGPIEKEIVDKAFTFPLGIPGYPDARRFVFSQTPDEHPFARMLCLEKPDLVFAVIDAFYLKPDYVVDIDDTQLEVVGSPGPLDCLIFFILKIEGGKPFRVKANLRAPLLLNKEKRLGRQIVMADESLSDQAVFEF